MVTGDEPKGARPCRNCHVADDFFFTSAGAGFLFTFETSKTTCLFVPSFLVTFETGKTTGLGFLITLKPIKQQAFLRLWALLRHDGFFDHF